MTKVTPEACFVVKDPTSDKPKLEVILPDSKAGIGHNTVKIFGFMVAQLYSNYRPSVKFSTLKIGLSRTFFTDLVGEGVFVEEDVDNPLGKGVFSKLKANSADKNEDILRGIRFEAGGGEGVVDGSQKEFEEEIFAESFDSFYCNQVAKYDDDTVAQLRNNTDDLDERNRLLMAVANTNKFMAQAFPETFKIFMTGLVTKKRMTSQKATVTIKKKTIKTVKAIKTMKTAKMPTMPFSNCKTTFVKKQKMRTSFAIPTVSMPNPQRTAFAPILANAPAAIAGWTMSLSIFATVSIS